MKTRFILVTVLLMILLPGCANRLGNLPAPASIASTVTPFPLPPTWTAAPTFSPLPTQTITPGTVDLISVGPTPTVTAMAPLTSEIPVFPGAEDVSYAFMAGLTGQPGESLYYSVSAATGEIETFYMEELARAGWIGWDPLSSIQDSMRCISLLPCWSSRIRSIGSQPIS